MCKATRYQQPKPALSTVGAGQATWDQAKEKSKTRLAVLAMWFSSKPSVSQGCDLAQLPRNPRERQAVSPTLLTHGPAPQRLP